MLLPVAKMAIQAGYDVRFLALTTARRMVESEGIRALGFADLIEFAAHGAAQFGLELAEGLAPDGPVALAESVAYLGASFADLVAEYGEAEARRLYAEKGRHSFLPTGFFRRWLASLRPDMVIATNSPRSEQAAILASRALGIPSICAVDLFALQEVRWIGQAGYADRLCVLNAEVRQMMLEHGRRHDEVIVTGNPAFDRLVAPEAAELGQRYRRARGWDDSRRTILWASQVEPEHHPFDGRPGNPDLPRQVEGELRAFVGANPGYRLLVRYHPSERVPFLPEPNVEFSGREENLDAVLNAVDIVVVTASTVGLEAAIAGRPVISVDCSVFTADTPYARFGISVGVDAPTDVARAIAALPARAAVAGRQYGIAGAGHATTQVFDVIKELMTEC
jgi:glycosyltransferase involved in cell wall biosynthesis